MTNANGRRSQRHPDEHELVQAIDASAALRQLLAAASAPPSTAELKGRSRAIADFRAAQRPGGVNPQPADPAIGPAGSGRRVTAKLARAGRWSAARLTVAGTALVVLLGGTAAAAAAGELPTALQNAVSDLFNAQTPAGDSPTPTPTGTAESRPERTGGGPSPAPSSSPAAGAAAGRSAASASPPRLVGLCHAYQAAGSATAMLTRPGFAPLVTAADGVPGVAGFCAELTGPAKAAPAGSAPAGSAPPGSAPPGSAPANPVPGSGPSGSGPSGSGPPNPVPGSVRSGTRPSAAPASPARPAVTSRVRSGAGPRSQLQASRHPTGPARD
ncbi:MAG: hypothetical protein ABI047_04660 [Jatrophihabitantaceae bacterium]